MPGATDNYVGNLGSGGESYASDAISSVHFPRVKMTWGLDGTATDVSGTNPMPVSLTSTTITGTVTTNATLQTGANVIGSLAANQSVNAAQVGGVAPSLNTGVRDAGTRRVTIATNDLVPVSLPGSSLMVTATGAVNTAVTATLPAPGVGLFHYITSIQVMKKYSVIGVAAGAGIIITSTNLPGTPAWDTEQLASAAGTVARVIDLVPGTPIRSAVANTATTIVAPLQLQTIWRINISYYTGP